MDNEAEVKAFAEKYAGAYATVSAATAKEFAETYNKLFDVKTNKVIIAGYSHSLLAYVASDALMVWSNYLDYMGECFTKYNGGNFLIKVDLGRIVYFGGLEDVIICHDDTKKEIEQLIKALEL